MFLSEGKVNHTKYSYAFGLHFTFYNANERIILILMKMIKKKKMYRTFTWLTIKERNGISSPNTAKTARHLH